MLRLACLSLAVVAVLFASKGACAAGRIAAQASRAANGSSNIAVYTLSDPQDGDTQLVIDGTAGSDQFVYANVLGFHFIVGMNGSRINGETGIITNALVDDVLLSLKDGEDRAYFLTPPPVLDEFLADGGQGIDTLVSLFPFAGRIVTLEHFEVVIVPPGG